MVSKVAVIALVAIVACPILLGYAMNLSEVTETDYKLSEDNLNVTPLLQDSTEYSYASANIVDLNTRFMENYQYPSYPYFNNVTSAKTAIPMSVSTSPGGPHNLADFTYLYYVQDYDPNNGYSTLYVTFNDSTTSSIIGFHSAYWVAADGVLLVEKYIYVGGQWTTNIEQFGALSNVQSINYSKPPGISGHEILYYYWNNSPPTTYVDISSGFILNKYNTYSSNDRSTYVDLAWHSNNVLLTMDLSSITSSSYTFDMNDSTKTFRFEKTTDGSGVHWLLKVKNGGSYDTLTELYYDSSKSSNTYQILLNLDKASFRYVGSWPTLIGFANSYWEYEYTRSSPISEVILNFTGISPKIRLDYGEYRAYQYPIIQNEIYDPAQFRENPATTINDPMIYGSSITFGGNTYTVTDGNITLGTHQVPVKGLVLSSVPVAGGYENRIGNTVVSTTVVPSAITFNGKWSASITTASMESYTYTKTEWTPGQFGWDGLDQNFLMVGLLTSLGVFIALGIYMRRTKAALWPLLIVCGGAAMLFFCML